VKAGSLSRHSDDGCSSPSFVPLIGNVRISIAIFSYNGGLYFGVTGDYDSSSDVDVLTAGVVRGAAELLALREPVHRARKQIGPKRPKSKARGARPAGPPPTQLAQRPGVHYRSLRAINVQSHPGRRRARAAATKATDGEPRATRRPP
jgi:hypothetical protein